MVKLFMRENYATLWARMKKNMSPPRRHGIHGDSGLEFRCGARNLVYSCESINARLLVAITFIQFLSRFFLFCFYLVLLFVLFLLF